MVSFLKQSSHKRQKKRTGNFLYGQVPNPSFLSECTDTQLLLEFIVQKLVISSFDHIAPRGLGYFIFGDSCVSCSFKIPQDCIPSILQSLELLNFVVKVYCQYFCSSALVFSGHAARLHTHLPFQWILVTHHFCTQSSSSVTLLYSLVGILELLWEINFFSV